MRYWFIVAAGVLTGAALPSRSYCQQWLPSMPGYAHYEKLRTALRDAWTSGAISVSWEDGGKALTYAVNGKRYRYSIDDRKAVQIGRAQPRAASVRLAALLEAGPETGQEQPARGRQFSTEVSPDKKHKAYYRDRNVYLSDADGKNEVAVTTDGSDSNRIKYGTASWVYGEELEQRTAMWWSPDSNQLAYYKFDEGKVRDYYLEMDNLGHQTTMDAEPYPLPGDPNPIVDIYVYDLASRQSTRVDVRSGQPISDGVMGYYVFHIRWSPDGKELLFDRMTRRQDEMEIVAADPDTGACRVVVHDVWPMVYELPTPEFLADGRRFILQSIRTGFWNYYLYDLSGKLLGTLTANPFDAAAIVKVDEKAGQLFYMAHDGDNYLKMQLHRVGLDGRGDVRLTDPALNHRVDIAPDDLHFADVAQTHNRAPFTRLMDMDGHVLDTLATSDTTKLDALGVPRSELFTFKAADGSTDLYGIIQKPAHFDPRKKYPLLVSVYAGPETSGASETFRPESPGDITDLGFLVATMDSRGCGGRGKQILDAIRDKLGVTEIDDQAAGVRYLRLRPYVDGNRVGIFGTSYGGYASLMCLLRYPDVFQAASASSSPTDWRNYDTVYTERYMWLPQEDKAAYDSGSAMTYAKNLKGKLLLYYGTADNNVHPANTLQLIHALHDAGKSFEVQVGPDLGHSSVPLERMMEFFIQNLVLRGGSEAPQAAASSPALAGRVVMHRKARAASHGHAA